MKKLYALLLSLVMMFAFASTAMAADAPTMKVVINGDVVAENVAVNVGESVYDAIEWTGTTDDGLILKSLDGNGSVPYNSPVLEEYEYYTSAVQDEVLKRVNAALLAKYPDSDGLGLWMGNGMGCSNDGPYMAYVGYDWTFTVNGSRPVDPNNTSLELYMNQTTIAAGDSIVLNYGETIEVWEY